MDLILIFFFKLVCLACRLVNDCAKLTAKAGYKYFGIQFYGECWSGIKSGLEYYSGGPSNNCISENATRCDDNSCLSCAGEQYINYVYETNLE